MRQACQRLFLARGILKATTQETAMTNKQAAYNAALALTAEKRAGVGDVVETAANLGPTGLGLGGAALGAGTGALFSALSDEEDKNWLRNLLLGGLAGGGLGLGANALLAPHSSQAKADSAVADMVGAVPGAMSRAVAGQIYQGLPRDEALSHLRDMASAPSGGQMWQDIIRHPHLSERAKAKLPSQQALAELLRTSGLNSLTTIEKELQGPPRARGPLPTGSPPL